MIERIVTAFEIDRERDSSVAIPAPEPRPGLEVAFEPSQVPVRLNLASPEQAASLTALRRERSEARELGAGPAPLVALPTPAGPTRGALSYTAISSHDDGGHELFAGHARAGDQPAESEGGVVRGRAVHALLEWSQANGWREPGAELIRRVATSAEVGAESDLSDETLLAPLRAWLGSPFFAERVRNVERSRVEVPLLIEVAGTVMRGSIDLLVEGDGAPPLIVDYKTDRLDGATPAELAGRYEIQQAIYALAVAEARGVDEVELAYVFLERPEDPVVLKWGAGELTAARSLLESEIHPTEIA